MPKQWRIHSHDSQRIAQLERAAGVPTVVAQLLLCRGIYDPADARLFLDAKLSGLREPDALPGVLRAAERIIAAVAARERITIYGDYDADGMTGTATLFLCLRLLGADVGYFVPNRLDDGYGLNADSLRMLAERGTKLVITVDCGIANIAEAEIARELGLELIITDHHEFAERLPAAAALIHPRLPGHAYPFGGLSGSGVAFKLAWALCQQANQAKRVSERMREFLLQAVGLAAIGTIADMVPLLDENRVLVRHGLNSLKERPTVGLAALMRRVGLDKKLRIECEDVGFALAPRLNAAGRFGQAQLAVELLTTDNLARAEALAEYINELNGSRESLERSIYLAANKQAQELYDPEMVPALVLADPNWHAGVIGIVAGRLAEKYHRPVVLIALDALGTKPGIGSARSVRGFNLHEALAACSQHLVSHGGHAAAAGLKIDEARLADFRADFCSYAANEISAADRVAELWIDSETTFSALTMRAVEQIEQLAPFGQGNTRPLLCASGVRLAEAPKKIGGGGRHLSLKLVQHGVSLRGIAFGGGEWADELQRHSGGLSLAFRPIINEFHGRRTVEIQISDWQPLRAP
ncbi:MAG TPA: single-stranded-DNA-specific exonuclease RecJ [Pirellulales bacterium]|jgi:single-stranded-DNA-specific exonuclease|nr:single-stranded-DNA-specific exonuclease RecJ [Pirellulales bacterium]